MFTSLRSKVFILLLLANGLMVAALFSLNVASFSRSFERYVIQLESRRLQPLTENIAKEFALTKNWQWLDWDNSRWTSIVRQSLVPPDLPQDARPDNRPPFAGRGRAVMQRLFVRDSQSGEILLGRQRAPADLIWLPIHLPETNQLIAELGFQPAARLDHQFDEIFARRQQHSLIIVSLLTFVIAALLAIPFSGWLVKPIQKMTLAVKRMTDGNLTIALGNSRNDELGQLARDINRLAEVLTQNQQDRRQWVSDIAHELRTPVAIFQADIEAVQDGVREVNARWLAMMHQQVTRLARLVNDLHQLSQSDAGTLSYRFADTDVSDLIQQTLDAFAESYRAAHILPNWNPPAAPALVRADAARLTQLLTNLAENTLRYTDGTAAQPGILKISLTCEPEQMTLHWEDSAPAVTEQDLQKLFDRLYRVDESRSRKSGGSGLGLAIVKNVVAAHKGQIGAAHSELGGLRINVSLPRT